LCEGLRLVAILILAGLVILFLIFVKACRFYFLTVEAREPFVGPLFSFELVRLARRGLQPRLRGLLVVVLLVGLLFVYVSHLPYGVPMESVFSESATMSRNAMAKFGESFMVMFLTVQLVAVTLLAPIYTAGGIIEEKDRKTLEFLQSSPLSSHEIILGKFFARLAFVLAIILAGLPVLMFTTFFGGVDPERLLAGFVIAIVTAIHLGSFSLMQAVKRSTVSGAIFRTYLMLALMTLLGCVCLPCATFFSTAISSPTAFYVTVVIPETTVFSTRIFPIWEIFGIYVGLHLTMSFFFLRAAIYRLREPSPDAGAMRLVQKNSEAAATVRQITPDENRSLERLLDLRENAPPLKDNDDPMIWKELHFTARFGPDGKGLQTLLVVLMTMALYPVALYLFIGLVKDINEGVWIDRTVNLAVRIVMEIVLLCGPLLVGLRTAACIGGERQKETMLTLLTLPWNRAEILSAKWWSAMRWIRGPLMIAGVSLVLGVCLLGVHPFGAMAGAALFCGFLSFCASAGLMLSVFRSSVMRATMAFVFVWLFAMFGAAFFVSWLKSSLPLALWRCLVAWNEDYRTGFPGETDGLISHTLPGILMGLLFFALSWLCWRVAVKRFEKEGMGI
jgi:ABC-type transport system involved in multi-copper enzyme maturation permease subunit